MRTGPQSAANKGPQRYQVSANWQWLVFDTLTPRSEVPESTVWVANLATGKTMQWTDSAIFDGVQFISPDSRVVVMQGKGVTEGQLYLLPLPLGGQRRKITPYDASETSSRPPNVHQIVWSPDNSWFVIVPPFGPDSDLYLIHVNGRVIKQYHNFPYLGEPVRFTAQWSDCR
jgi:hypothetical protein